MTIAAVSADDSKQRIADTTHELLLEADSTPDPRHQQLLDEVVILNAPVARSIASRYRSKGVDADDLEQVAYLGLVKAANGYRIDASTAFLSYAVPTIRGELKRYFRDCAWTVRPPRRVQEMQGSIAAAEPELIQRLGHVPTDEETAAALGTDPAEVAEASSVRGCFTTLSLDAPGCGRGRHQPARHGRRRRGRLRPGRERAHPDAGRRRASATGTSASSSCGSATASPRKRSATSSASARCRCPACSAASSTASAPTSPRSRSGREVVPVASAAWTSRRRRMRSTRRRLPTSLLLATSWPSS